MNLCVTRQRSGSRRRGGEGPTRPAAMASLWHLYEQAAQAAPLLTDCANSLVLWSLGDLGAQRIEGKVCGRQLSCIVALATAASFRHLPGSAKRLASACGQAKKSFHGPGLPQGSSPSPAPVQGFKPWRLLSTALYGFFAIGPFGHIWYARPALPALGLPHAASPCGRQACTAVSAHQPLPAW